MNTPQTAAEFLAWVKSLGHWDTWTAAVRDLRKTFFFALPPDERYLVQRAGIEAYFVDENRGAPHPPVLSPLGHYRLLITPFNTLRASGKTTWSYTLGEVFRVADGMRVAAVMRNYSSFPHAWMENHVDGHDYLVCGEDYQGQTFCQLDTGKVRNLIPDEAFNGFGFCWARFKRLEDGRTLMVDGCYWACPYEIRFYDVSAPLEKGWPQLEFPEEVGCIDADDGTVEIRDGLILWSTGDPRFKATGERKAEIEAKHSRLFSEVYRLEKQNASAEEIVAAKVRQQEHDAAHPDQEDAPDAWETVVDQRIVLRIEDGKLVLVEQWKSDHLLDQEQATEKYLRKEAEQRRAWIDNDPLIKVLGDRIPDVGFCYPSYDMRCCGEKNPAFFGIQGRKYDPNVSHDHSASLNWGVLEGDVVLELSVRGKSPEKVLFPRSAEGVLAAWKRGQEHLQAEVR